MNLNAESDVISKAEFARRRNVDPSRVSQWLSEGKISRASLVGEGRGARIRESTAVAELRRGLDPMQMAGNGLSTDLTPPALSVAKPAAPQVAAPNSLDFEAAALAVPPPVSTVPAVDTIEEQIKRARLQQIERVNREGKRQEALEAGRLADVQLARAITMREVSKLLTDFEGSLSTFATAVAAEFKLQQRDVLHLLRGEYSKLRSTLAKTARRKADALDATMTVDFGGEDGS